MRASARMPRTCKRPAGRVGAQRRANWARWREAQSESTAVQGSGKFLFCGGCSRWRGRRGALPSPCPSCLRSLRSHGGGAHIIVAGKARQERLCCEEIDDGQKGSQTNHERAKQDASPRRGCRDRDYFVRKGMGHASTRVKSRRGAPSELHAAQHSTTHMWWSS